jgi:hypothetical protein
MTFDDDLTDNHPNNEALANLHYRNACYWMESHDALAAGVTDLASHEKTSGA